MHTATKLRSSFLAGLSQSKICLLHKTPKVHFYQSKGAVKAVIGPFGGFPTDKDYQAKSAELKEALDKDGLKYDEKTVSYAGYSSSFQFRNRKQEVHVNIVS